MSVGPELSSMNTALEELAARLGGMADELAGSQRDDVAVALYEVERSLRTAQRRLTKVVSQLD
ncbi:MAG: hypothetical protein JF603_15145 [Acidobacteria bacterium]|nr:hypothetical protein [Acidobacteriota bacterium]